MGMRVSLEPLEKNISFIVRPTNKPTYEDLLEENKQLKERLERIDNYLDKNYTAENQYWFDHIRDIVEDR